MTKRDFDARRAQWLDAMVDGAYQLIRKEGDARDGEEFSALMPCILQAAFDREGRIPGRFGGVAFGMGENAKVLRVSAKTLRRHLRAAAQAGIIKCVTWYDPLKKKRFPLEVVVNPLIFECYGKTGLNNAKAIGQAFGALWLDRRNQLKPMQGFTQEDTVPWGRWSDGEDAIQEIVLPDDGPRKTFPELLEVAKSDIGSQIAAAATGGKKTVDALKKEDQRRKREVTDAFIAGCASVWVSHRARQGHGHLPPPWVSANLSPSARAERQELVKVFATYGGRVAATAWGAYCGYSGPKLDAKGRREFNPDIAFRQYAGADKPPKIFARYIVQIIDLVTRAGWVASEESASRLRQEFFGISFDQMPFQAASVRVPPPPQPKQEQVHGDPSAAPTSSRGSSNVAPDARLLGETRGGEVWPPAPGVSGALLSAD
jgi:hypothetical protein